MDRRIALNCLLPEHRAVICEIHVQPTLRRRLEQFGVMEGTRIRRLSVCPLGDPTLYRARGTSFALRGRDAAGITVLTENQRGDAERI